MFGWILPLVAGKMYRKFCGYIRWSEGLGNQQLWSDLILTLLFLLEMQKELEAWPVGGFKFIIYIYIQATPSDTVYFLMPMDQDVRTLNSS